MNKTKIKIILNNVNKNENAINFLKDLAIFTEVKDKDNIDDIFNSLLDINLKIYQGNIILKKDFVSHINYFKEKVRDNIDSVQLIDLFSEFLSNLFCQLENFEEYKNFLKKISTYFSNIIILKLDRVDHFNDDIIKKSIYIGQNKILAQTHFGCDIILSSLNVDVCHPILKSGWWEMSIDKLLRCILKKGDICINGGANFGYFTLLISYIIGDKGKLFSVEANNWIFGHLAESVYRSGMSNRVHLFNCALGRTDTDEYSKNLELIFSPFWAGGGGGVSGKVSEINAGLSKKSLLKELSDPQAQLNHSNKVGDFNEKRKFLWDVNSDKYFNNAKVLSIDEIIDQNIDVDLILLDIENMDCIALNGAKKTISRSKNIKIIFEFSTVNLPTFTESQKKINKIIFSNKKSIIKFLEENNFDFYIIEDVKINENPKLLKINPNNLLNLKDFHGNIFCCSNNISID